MTVRNPLVLIPGGNPQIQELPAGDVLGGAAQGPVGMTWQGTWNSGTSYAIDDAVTYNGTSYIAIATSTNQTPPNATYWNVLASKGDAGATGPTGPAGPSGGGDCIKIARVVTSGSASTIAFGTIAGTYSNLRLVVVGRDTSTSSGQLSVRMTMNGDTTAANYDVSQAFHASNTATGASQTSSSTSGLIVGQIPGTSGNAAAFGVIDVVLAGYANTTFYKMVQGLSSIYRNASPGAIDVMMGAAVWKSTAAITSVTLTAGGTAFLDGTTATLYGLN